MQRHILASHFLVLKNDRTTAAGMEFSLWREMINETSHVWHIAMCTLPELRNFKLRNFRFMKF
jgi:hypothetical protein